MGAGIYGSIIGLARLLSNVPDLNLYPRPLRADIAGGGQLVLARRGIDGKPTLVVNARPVKARYDSTGTVTLLSGDGGVLDVPASFDDIVVLLMRARPHPVPDIVSSLAARLGRVAPPQLGPLREPRQEVYILAPKGGRLVGARVAYDKLPEVRYVEVDPATGRVVREKHVLLVKHGDCSGDADWVPLACLGPVSVPEEPVREEILYRLHVQKTVRALRVLRVPYTASERQFNRAIAVFKQNVDALNRALTRVRRALRGLRVARRGGHPSMDALLSATMRGDVYIGAAGIRVPTPIITVRGGVVNAVKDTEPAWLVDAVSVDVAARTALLVFSERRGLQVSLEELLALLALTGDRPADPVLRELHGVARQLHATRYAPATEPVRGLAFVKNYYYMQTVALHADPGKVVIEYRGAARHRLVVTSEIWVGDPVECAARTPILEYAPVFDAAVDAGKTMDYIERFVALYNRAHSPDIRERAEAIIRRAPLTRVIDW